MTPLPNQLLTSLFDSSKEKEKKSLLAGPLRKLLQLG